MSKIKKLLLSGLSMVLVAVLAIGGTLAYLTDRDSEVNTFTVGDVTIDLHEKFEQGAELLPGVKVQKEVTIENTGKNDAWVWYTITYPKALDLTDSGQTILWTGFTTENHDNAGYAGANDGVDEWLIEYTGAPYLKYFTKDGVEMVEFAVLYQQTLAPNAITPTSLECVYLDKAIDIDPDGNLFRVTGGNAEAIDWNVNEDGNPYIFVSAYAIQANEFETVKDAYAAYNKQWGDNGTEYAPIEEPLSEIAVNPENLSSVDFSQDNAVFKFSGTFTDDLTISVQNGLNQTFDATKAIFESDTTVTVNAPGIAHSYSSLSAPRSGVVTIKGFNAETINVLAYNNEAVNIVNNTTKAISVIGGNFALNISNNNVNGNFGTYKDGENQTNDYAISLRITEYELSIKDNTITDAYSHAIGINGRQGEAASDWGNCGANNKIIAFSGNNITVNSTQKAGRAALKIWCDQVYAPYATSGQQPNAAASKLMSDIKADTTNVITLGDTHTAFNIFDYKQ